VLDNFEQVVEHAQASLGRWIERAPDARFLVTSRERLGLAGEDAWLLDPLAEQASVELFLERTRAHAPGFSLEAGNKESVRELVSLLEGLPLAIELAAARLRVLSLAQVLERMKDRFRLLAGGRGDGRHATLKVAIDGYLRDPNGLGGARAARHVGVPHAVHRDVVALLVVRTAASGKASCTATWVSFTSTRVGRSRRGPISSSRSPCTATWATAGPKGSSLAA